MRRFLALLLFPLVGFAGSIAYVFLIGRVLGRNDFALVAAPIVLPLFALVCGVIWFVLLSLWEARAGKRRGPAGPLLLSLGVALAFGLVVAGPRGFTLAGGSELFNVYLLVVVPIAAWWHRRVVGAGSSRG